MLCPRRIESGRYPDGQDTWDSDDTCTYCGSLNPDTLMKRLEAGDIEVIPTDKNYKIYLRNDGGEQFDAKFRDCPLDSNCAGPKECTHWTTEKRDRSKFYFQHLSGDQQVRFVKLVNDKKIKFARPGYFYNMPFFMRVKESEDS